MNEILIPTLAFVSATCLGGAVVAARAAKRRRLRERLLGAPASARPGPAEPYHEGPGTAERAFTAIGERVTHGRSSVPLQQELAQAGYYAENAATVFIGVKLFLLLSTLIMGGVLILPLALPPLFKPLAVVALASAAFFAPNVFVHTKRRRRREEVRAHLPNALDLLEICVSSGMGMDMAWNAVSDQIRSVSPTLADEMALTNLEIHLGAPRHQAMRHLADRTGSTEIASLVAVLVQSERFGTSIADALRTYSDSVRDARSQFAQETAEKMTVKLIVPLVLFIFPAVLIVLAGPAAIVLSRTLMNL